MSISRLSIRVVAVLGLLAALGAQPAPARAEPGYDPTAEAERALLLRFLEELDASAALLRQARRAASPSAARRFDYRRLAQDLRILRSGILGYLRESGAVDSPEQWEALEGTYAR